MINTAILLDYSKAVNMMIAGIARHFIFVYYILPFHVKPAATKKPLISTR
jgi:hypothetical protein